MWTEKRLRHILEEMLHAASHAQNGMEADASALDINDILKLIPRRELVALNDTGIRATWLRRLSGVEGRLLWRHFVKSSQW